MDVSGWLVSLLGAIGLPKLWRAVRRAFAWLKPTGLAADKPLFFNIGETAYIASHPYVRDREVKDIIVQVNLGNPSLLRSMTIMTFRLIVGSRPPYPVSEARRSENGGWYLVPSGGGFSTVPNKEYVRLPITIPAGQAAVGWVGFCMLERSDLRLAEARNIDAKVVAVQADGTETSYRLPVCELPLAAD